MQEILSLEKTLVVEDSPSPFKRDEYLSIRNRQDIETEVYNRIKLIYR
jgi:hypothetical protein